MNTIVITADPLDVGAGSSDRLTFADCGWHVDEAGTLHIKRANERGNRAAFGAGHWRAVMQDNAIVAREASR